MKARRVSSIKELKKGVTILTLLKKGEDDPEKVMYIGEIVKVSGGKVMIRPLASSDDASLGEDARKDIWEVPVVAFELYALEAGGTIHHSPEDCRYEDYVLDGPEVVKMLTLLIGAGNTNLIT